MRVLLVNGSPHAKGCTYTALSEVAKTLNEEGIETEIFQVGAKPISGCIACGSCRTKGKCYIADCVNEFVELAQNADGFVFGSPVHYAAASGAITSFMDRVFYSALCSGKQAFYLKPAACVVSARRAGTTATFDQLNKYFTISEMPRLVTLLEYGTWSITGRRAKGFGRDANDAYTGQKYGMVFKMQGRGHQSRCSFTQTGRSPVYEFYPVIRQFGIETL